MKFLVALFPPLLLASASSSALVPAPAPSVYHPPNAAPAVVAGRRRLSGDGDIPDPPTDPPTGGGGGGIQDCFSAITIVEVEDKGPIPMTELNVGDRVLTSTGEFSEVYAFGHRKEDEPRMFYSIETEDSEQTLEVTERHLLYLAVQEHPIRTDALVVGDILSKQDGSTTRIQNIRTIYRQGFYAPLTKEGNIVVNGLKASSYVSFQGIESGAWCTFQNGWSTGVSQHQGAHIVAAPLRIYCSWNKCESYTEQGMPRYIYLGLKLARWMDAQNTVTQLFLYITAGSFMGIIYALEVLFTKYSLGYAILVLMGVFMAMKIMFKSCKSSS